MSVLGHSFDDLILHDSDGFDLILDDKTDRNIHLTANEMTEEMNAKSFLSRKRKALYEEDMRSQRPRLVKTDFRRHFASMWTDVFNSCDRDVMMDHINRFYEKDVSLKLYDMRQWKPDYSAENEVTAQGIAFLTDFWFKNMNSAPDLVCRIKHTAVTVRSDNTSVVRCCFTLTGTKILHMADAPDADTVDSFLHYKASVPQDNAEISPTAAALAAVAPRKVAALHRAERIDRLAATRTTVPTAMAAPINVCTEFQTAEAVFSYCPEEDDTVLGRHSAPPVHAEAVSFRDALDLSPVSNNDVCSGTSDSCQDGAEAEKGRVDEAVVLEVQQAEDAVFMLQATAAPSPMQEPLQDQQMQQMLLFQQFRQQQTQQPRARSIQQEQSALTAALDCVCSFEMHFNAAQKVHLMVVNYIT